VYRSPSLHSGRRTLCGSACLATPSLPPRSTPFFEAFWEELHTLGYVEGQNLALELRTAEGKTERLPALAAELARLPVDVLVAPGPEATLQAARQVTRTIPTVKGSELPGLGTPGRCETQPMRALSGRKAGSARVCPVRP